MSTRFAFPAPTNDDRLPHDKAVWRDCSDRSLAHIAGRQISIDYGDGQIVETWGQLAHWRGAARWRFGWGPR